MKRFKIGFRVWIAISSVIGFMGGWALLAHSPKPVQASQPAPIIRTAPLPTLEPIPPLQGLNRSVQPIQPIPQIQMGFPRLRTGGS
jgi:hypothetical protein